LNDRPAAAAGAGALFAAGSLYLLLAVASTWPLAIHFNDELLFSSRRFDGYGTIWLGEHFWRALSFEAPLLHDTAVAWPKGLDLRLADSFLFGLLYLPFRFVFSPVAAFNAFSLVAIASTGAAGAWLAHRVLGVGRAAAFAAGLVLAFNTLTHTYRIEGEAYLLAGLFLPAFAGQLVLAARSGAVRDGVKAGLLFGALAWSSGYYAVDGAILLAVLGSAILVGWERGRLRPTLPAIGGFLAAAVITVVPLALMVGAALDGAIAARFPEGQDPLRNVALDSLSLTGLLVPVPGTAHLRQGRIGSVGLVPLCFGLLALAVRSPRKVLPWLILSAVGVTLALGPYLRLDDRSFGTLRLPYAGLYAISRSVLAYRMPARFLALSFVGLAALVALFLDRLRRDGLRPRWTALLLGLLLADGLLFTGFATDTTRAPATVPSAYASLSGKGALLDLWGYDRDLLRFAGLSAFYQTHHGQPCMTDFTRAGDAQTVTNRRLSLALADGREAEAQQILGVLARLGVTDLALHTSGFRDSDLSRMKATLSRLTKTAAASAPTEDDPVILYHIPPANLDIDGAWAEIQAWAEDSGA
jgi:hypothetical protein